MGSFGAGDPEIVFPAWSLKLRVHRLVSDWKRLEGTLCRRRRLGFLRNRHAGGAVQLAIGSGK